MLHHTWPEGRETVEIRTFGTMTVDLLALSDWLTSKQITHVAMESTGEFWKPIYNLLEGNFELLVVNAKHRRMFLAARPMSKTPNGSLNCCVMACCAAVSFRRKPSTMLHLTRQRTNLVQDRATVVNRLQKVLEWANLKLSSVATNVTGVSARAISLKRLFRIKSIRRR